ncbi:MAG TPA: disulfide bond formation protein DsbA [Opitutaceae bacterium]|nr:disulfide bond formation protein DsbA [Opitutaceae bacterium]
MKVTYYLEVISSWCHWAEPAWAELKSKYADRVDFQWKIALMRPEDYPVSREQCEWFYRRSGTIMRSAHMLNPGWMVKGKGESFDNPSLVAEAGKDFGVADDRIRLALARAAVIDGRKVAGMAESATIGAKASGIPVQKLKARASSAAVRARAEASTEEFFSHQIKQRPAFIIESAIGDKVVLSGLARAEPIAACIESMLSDAAAYKSYAAHFGSVPAK